MDETLVGTVPTTPMTNRQRTAHRNLARAEKHLIHLIEYRESDTRITVARIERAEATCRRLTTQWKRVCAS